MTFVSSQIIPSIIAKDQHEFAARLMRVSFSHKIHIDVMDGVFVNATSFSKEEDFDFKHLHHFDEVEIHLMVHHPKHWIEYLHDITTMFIVHAEIQHISDVITDIKKSGKKVGLAINPNTTIDEVRHLLSQVDQVTIMTVHPGAYGSKFLPDVLEKVFTIREEFPSLPIECDGGMNEETIVVAKNSGATKFIAGSVLQNASNPHRMFTILNEAYRDA